MSSRTRAARAAHRRVARVFLLVLQPSGEEVVAQPQAPDAHKDRDEAVAVGRARRAVERDEGDDEKARAPVDVGDRQVAELEAQKPDERESGERGDERRE